MSDVQIDGWMRPWNRKEKRSSPPPDDHVYTVWATNVDNQLGEVGCIYSVQGFEFDYIGVIWGDDLVWRDSKWVAYPGESSDPEMKRISADKALDLLQNAYRVLCSRGIRGCYIFCLDAQTRHFLRSALGAL